MAVRYLFNTAGEYVAFAKDQHVFAPKGDWIGFVRSGNLLYNTNGEFLGYILEDDRVARKKSEGRRPRAPVPLRPLRPLVPLRPLKRLRKPKLPYPYEDVFEHGVPGQSIESTAPVHNLNDLEGSVLQAADGTYLGKVTRNAYDSESVANQYGTFGSPYSANSIFNEYGPYGSPYNQLSPYNDFSRTPPRLVRDGRVIAHLTSNQFISPRVDPAAFKAWLRGE